MKGLRILAALFLVSFASVSVIANDSDKAGNPSPAPASAATTVAASGSCLTDPSAIEDIRKQREALQARERELAAKEAELRAREEAVAEELKRFDGIRKELAKIEGSRKAEDDERVNKLVETLETMSPKAASQLLSTLDETLAVSAISRISTQRLAKIMNLMEPAKSSRLTELMAGVVRAKGSPQKGAGSTASLGAAVTTEKGKEVKTNDQIN